MQKKPKQNLFSERVIAIALAIPKGRVATYGQIARLAGAGPMASQSITSILGKATNSGIKNIPYHRIVYANGKVWLSDANRAKRIALYKKEGIQITADDRIVNFRDVLLQK